MSQLIHTLKFKTFKNLNLSSALYIIRDQRHLWSISLTTQTASQGVGQSAKSDVGHVTQGLANFSAGKSSDFQKRKCLSFMIYFYGPHNKALSVAFCSTVNYSQLAPTLQISQQAANLVCRHTTSHNYAVDAHCCTNKNNNDFVTF